MPRLNRRWISFFALSAATLITCVAIVGWVSFEEGTSLKSKLNAYGVDPNSDDAANSFTNWTSAELALGIVVNIDSFDPVKSGTTLGIRLDYTPLNNLLDAVGESEVLAPKVPVRVLLMSTTTNFAANTVMPIKSINQILDGDINRYPFDKYVTDFLISAYTSPTNISYGTPLPITAFVVGAVQGFKIKTEFQGLSDDGSQLQLAFTVTRSPISKTFAIITFIVMWCLSSAIFVAAMSTWFRGKKVEPPLIALSTAMLFAMPNVRNSQPGIPPIAGTTSDMVGFFWNVLLVAIRSGCSPQDAVLSHFILWRSAFSLIINYIIKNRRTPLTTISTSTGTKDLEVGKQNDASDIFLPYNREKELSTILH